MVPILITLLIIVTFKEIIELTFKEGKYKRIAKTVLLILCIGAVPINVFLILRQNEESTALNTTVGGIDSTVGAINEDAKILHSKADTINNNLKLALGERERIVAECNKNNHLLSDKLKAERIWLDSNFQESEVFQRKLHESSYALFPLSYTSAIHSTEIKMPAGKGITCGMLLAGAFSGKNSL
jgi:hypothetical protein